MPLRRCGGIQTTHLQMHLINCCMPMTHCSSMHRLVFLQHFMSYVGDAGRQYGLSLNWSKVEVMPIRCECHFAAPDGTPIKAVQLDHLSPESKKGLQASVGVVEKQWHRYSCQGSTVTRGSPCNICLACGIPLGTGCKDPLPA